MLLSRLFRPRLAGGSGRTGFQQVKVSKRAAAVARAKEAQEARDRLMTRFKRIVFVGGMGLFSLGSFVLYRVYRDDASESDPSILLKKTEADVDPLHTFEEMAPDYDSKIEWDETLFGFRYLRRQLVKRAEGRTLEIAGGTGRNLPYYVNPQLGTVTVTDASPAMLRTAKEKLLRLQDQSRYKNMAPLEFEQQDAHTLSFPDNSFHTVIDTFGLCSFENPEKVLQEMKRVCHPAGKILLLEHGKSSKYQWMSDWLDKNALPRALKWGCWWNRDIEAMIRDDPELKVIHRKSYHLGTTYFYVIRPSTPEQ